MNISSARLHNLLTKDGLFWVVLGSGGRFDVLVCIVSSSTGHTLIQHVAVELCRGFRLFSSQRLGHSISLFHNLISIEYFIHQLVHRSIALEELIVNV
jgi:hypothetical protein